MERIRDMVAGTIQALESIFPEIKIDYLLRKEAEDFWKSYLQAESQPVTLGVFITSLLKEFLPENTRRGLTIALYQERTRAGIRILIEAPNLVFSDGRTFTLTQVYCAEEGKLTIYLSDIVAPAQGRKFVKTSLLAHAKLFGAVKIKLRASSIGGSQEGVFAWARYGFIPVGRDLDSVGLDPGGRYWDIMRRWGLDKLKENLALPEQVREALLDPEPVALRRLVYLSWTAPNDIKEQMKNFLNNMLSCNVSWDGELDLTDQASRDWIESYANERSAECFTDLVPVISGCELPPDIEKKD